MYWSAELLIGNTTIDNQHKELFKKFEELKDTMNDLDDKTTLRHVIIFLEDYVIRHFSTEENLMDEVNYPERNTHKMKHANFIFDLEKFKDEFEKKGASIVLTTNTYKWLNEWLSDHIAKNDLEFGRFLKEKGVGG
jgi:hemerythrin